MYLAKVGDFHARTGLCAHFYDRMDLGPDVSTALGKLLERVLRDTRDACDGLGEDVFCSEKIDGELIRFTYRFADDDDVGSLSEPIDIGFPFAIAEEVLRRLKELAGNEWDAFDERVLTQRKGVRNDT